MDLTVVVSTAITGVVGIAGVAGAIVSARMASTSATKDLKLSISAENERARLAKKRQVYAAYYNEISRITLAIAAEDKSTDQGRTRITAAIVALFSAGTEVTLIAPPHINLLSVEAGKLISKYAYAVRDGSAVDEPKGFRPKVDELIRAMRDDLGVTS